MKETVTDICGEIWPNIDGRELLFRMFAAAWLRTLKDANTPMIAVMQQFENGDMTGKQFIDFEQTIKELQEFNYRMAQQD